MTLTQPTLFVHFGTTYTRAFLFSSDGKTNRLVDFQKTLTLSDPHLLLEYFQAKFKGRFANLKIIAQELPEQTAAGAIKEQEVFLEAGKLVSKSGEVLLIDVGSKKVSLVKGNFGKVSVSEFPLGLGQSAGQVLRQVSVEQLASLIELEIELVDIQNYLGKKTLYPGFIPFSAKELAIELAAAASILAEIKNLSGDVRRQTRYPKICVLSGACFGKAPQVRQALFYFIQGWQPRGVMQVFIDPQGFLYPYALMADLEGLMSRLKNLGTVISLNHQRGESERLGEAVLDLGLSESLKIEIKAGELLRIPFKAQAVGQLAISLKRGVLLKGEAASKGQIDGGEIGIVIDGRGRPLPKVPLNLAGKKKIKTWLEAL